MTRTPPTHRNTTPRSRRALAIRAAIGLSALIFAMGCVKSWERPSFGGSVGSLLVAIHPTHSMARETQAPREIWISTNRDESPIVSEDPPTPTADLQEPRRLLIAVFSFNPRYYGRMAPTTRENAWGDIFNWSAIDRGSPANWRAQLTENEQAALLTWIASEPEEHQPTLRRLLIDQQPEKVILLSGYLWNTAFIIALFLAGYLLSTTPFLWVRDHTIPARRRRQGRCIRCGYPLTTIANQPCPECGLHPPSNPSTTPIPPTP